MKRIVAISILSLFALSVVYSGKSKSIDRHIAVGATDKIEVRGFPSSKIDFKSWDKSEVYAKLTIDVSSSNEEYENDYINNVDLESTRTDSTMLIRLLQPSMSGRNGFSWSNLLKLKFTSYNSIEIKGEIYLPRNNPLLMEAKYCDMSLENMIGDLSLEGSGSKISLRNCKSVKNIDNDYGTTVIEQCGGSLKLNSSGSRVTVDKFDGAVDLHADYSTVQLHDIKMNAIVRSKSSANITAEHIGGNLTIDGDYSTLKLNDIKGFVTIEDEGGNIRIAGAEGLRIRALYAHMDISDVKIKSKEPLRIESMSGRIILENISGNVSIESPYSPMDLTTIRGKVEISTTSTQVHLEDIVGDLAIESEYTALRFRNITSDNVVISDKNSQIDFEAKNSPSKIDVKNEYGNVTLHLPKDYSAEMNLKVAYGTIKCDLPLDVEELGGGAFYVGKFGNSGKNVLNVRTSSGNISLKMK